MWRLQTVQGDDFVYQGDPGQVSWHAQGKINTTSRHHKKYLSKQNGISLKLKHFIFDRKKTDKNSLTIREKTAAFGH